MAKAVNFCAQAQTTSGGWGYVSAKDGSDFDEGSTTITQVQGLRACRNAGIPVPRKSSIARSSTSRSAPAQTAACSTAPRPAAAAAPDHCRRVACLFNAGDYDSDYVPKIMKYVDRHYLNVGSDNDGHWHYAHYYYAQVVYREGARSGKRTATRSTRACSTKANPTAS